MNYSSLQIPSRPSPDYIPPTDPQPETIPPEQEPPFESPPEIEPPERNPPIRDPEIPVPEGNINLENKPASAGFFIVRHRTVNNHTKLDNNYFILKKE